ncbi:hypothetical protein Nmel_014682 [Mimus melanotis]
MAEPLAPAGPWLPLSARTPQPTVSDRRQRLPRPQQIVLVRVLPLLLPPRVFLPCCMPQRLHYRPPRICAN